MPISRSEFEHRQIDASRYVEQLLNGFADMAFSVDEIVKVAAGEGRNFTKEEVSAALNALVESGKVEWGEVRGVLYYIYRRRPLGFSRGGG